MYVDHHYPHLNKVRYYLGSFTYYIHYVPHTFIEGWESIYRNFLHRQLLEEENTSLKQQNIWLSAQIQKFSGLLSENKRLKTLFLAADKQTGKLAMVAKLIGTNYTPFKQHILLDKGTKHQVYIGQPILDSKGILGQIISVTPFNATGILISDPSHSMMVQIGDLSIRGLLVGTGNPKLLKIEYIPLDVNIKVGDVITTSGLDHHYPPDYPIGHVAKIDSDPNDTFADISITPLANLNYGREVLLIWDKPIATKMDN